MSFVQSTWRQIAVARAAGAMFLAMTDGRCTAYGAMTSPKPISNKLPPTRRGGKTENLGLLRS